jgi:threonine/homoserine/homoserine lactone efflux protein
MLPQAIGAGLPAALAIALSPFPVIAIVLILAGQRGRISGPLFMIGWIAGLTAVITLSVVVLGGADDPDSTSAAIADWGRVVAGAALIVLGIRKWRSRPRPGDEVATPGWMASLDRATPGKAFVLGVLLSGANPKNVVLAAAGTTSMVEVGVEGLDMVVSAVVFVLVGSITVIGAVIVRFVGGNTGVRFLDGVRQFMVANSAVITVFVLVILGAKVLGDGLIGLGR